MKICSVTGCEVAAIARGWCPTHYNAWHNHGDPLHPRLKAKNGELEEWLRKHASFEGSDCLIWPYGRMSKGYAGIVFPRHLNGKATGAGRFMCELAHGKAPSPSHEAAHSCGNGHKACVNPNHIRWSTHEENELDKDLHGTRCIGTRFSTAKLDDDKVRQIRIIKKKNPQKNNQEIAYIFGVSRAAIHQVLSGKRWRHVV